MKRRAFAAIGVGISLSGCIDEIEDSVSDSGNDATTDGKEFGFGSPGFESIEWINLNVLRVIFEDDHEIDFFSINHEYRTEYDDALHVDQAPNFGGEVDYPIIDEIQNGDTVYPTRNFELKAYQGEAGFITTIDKKLGSVSFTIPENIAPPDSFE